MVNKIESTPVGFKKVSKDEFYKFIFALKVNVHPHIINGKYPYTSHWNGLSNDRKTYGISNDFAENGIWPVETNYFISSTAE